MTADAQPKRMILTRKMRLNPTRAQHRDAKAYAEQGQQLWNAALEERVLAYRQVNAELTRQEWEPKLGKDGIVLRDKDGNERGYYKSHRRGEKGYTPHPHRALLEELLTLARDVVEAASGKKPRQPKKPKPSTETDGEPAQRGGVKVRPNDTVSTKRWVLAAVLTEPLTWAQRLDMLDRLGPVTDETRREVAAFHTMRRDLTALNGARREAPTVLAQDLLAEPPAQLRLTRERLLAEMWRRWDATRSSLSNQDQSRALTVLRAGDPTYAGRQRRVQRNEIDKLQIAFDGFFKGGGHPQYRPRKFATSFAFDAFQQIAFDGKRLRFAGMAGGLRVRKERKRQLPASLRFTIAKGQRAFAAGDAFTVTVTPAAAGFAFEVRADASNIGDGTLSLGDPAYRGAVMVGAYRIVARKKDGDDKVRFEIIDPAGVVIDEVPAGMPYDVIKKITFKGEDRCGDHINRWFCGLQVVLPCTPERTKGAAVGVDWGTSVLAALSTGEMVPNPRHGDVAAAELRRVQRRVARGIKGSKRRAKVLRHKRALDRKTANRRRNTLDKLSKRLATHHALISSEAFPIKDLQNAERPGETVPKFVAVDRNRKMADTAPYMLRQMTTYKAQLYGARHVLVDPTSIAHDNNMLQPTDRCSMCGGLHFKEIDEEWHVCTAPGPFHSLRLPRKVNAARVIRLAACGDLPLVGGNRGGPVPGGVEQSTNVGTGQRRLGKTVGEQSPSGRRSLSRECGAVELPSQTHVRPPRPPPGRLRTETS